MNLNLTIDDPQVLHYLQQAGPDRVEERAYAALRCGVIALGSVRGQVDAEKIRNEGERIIEGTQALLQAHAAQVEQATSSELARYLDPKTGALEASIAKLREGSVAHIDILNGAVMAQVGSSGVMAQTLLRYIGEGSPLLRLLDPGQENGLRARIEKMLQDGVEAQRTAVLAEFSLDRKDSALSRLLLELETSNVRLTEELSLDKDDSALARLVSRVEAAAAKSTAELTRDGIERHIERFASENGGLTYDEMMALAERGDADRDRLLVVAEALATDRHPRLRRVFVERATGAPVEEEEVGRLLELAASGDEAGLERLDVVYRPVEARP